MMQMAKLQMLSFKTYITGLGFAILLLQLMWFVYFWLWYIGAQSSTSFSAGSGSIFLDNVRCSGTETRLLSCPANSIGSHNCGHYEDAGVICTTSECNETPTIMTVCYCQLFMLKACNDGDIRLSGGRNGTEGRVEVCNRASWGTVCDDSWGSTDAQVVCNQLGFASTGLSAIV